MKIRLMGAELFHAEVPIDRQTDRQSAWNSYFTCAKIVTQVQHRSSWQPSLQIDRHNLLPADTETDVIAPRSEVKLHVLMAAIVTGALSHRNHKLQSLLRTLRYALCSRLQQYRLHQMKCNTALAVCVVEGFARCVVYLKSLPVI
jgi:hypothetical protein